VLHCTELHHVAAHVAKKRLSRQPNEHPAVIQWLTSPQLCDV
jgi:hypothetical protein